MLKKVSVKLKMLGLVGLFAILFVYSQDMTARMNQAQKNRLAFIDLVGKQKILSQKFQQEFSFHSKLDIQRSMTTLDRLYKNNQCMLMGKSLHGAGLNCKLQAPSNKSVIQSLEAQKRFIEIIQSKALNKEVQSDLLEIFPKLLNSSVEIEKNFSVASIQKIKDEAESEEKMLWGWVVLMSILAVFIAKDFTQKVKSIKKHHKSR